MIATLKHFALNHLSWKVDFSKPHESGKNDFITCGHEVYLSPLSSLGGDIIIIIIMDLKRVPSLMTIFMDYIAIDPGVSEFLPTFDHMSLSLSWERALTKNAVLLLAED